MIPSNTRRIGLWSIAALFMAIACARTHQSEQAPSISTAIPNVPSTSSEQSLIAASSPPEEQAVAPTVDPIAGQWSDSLKKYFPESAVALLNQTVVRSAEIKSASDLAYFYQVVLRDSIQPLVEKHFREGCSHADYTSFADDDWDWIAEILPYVGTRASCHHLDDGSVGCSHVAPISLLPLREIAANTTEQEDDLFFDAQIAVHSGVDPGQMVGFEVFDGQDDYYSMQNDDCQSCDAGMLGDGHLNKVITKLAQASSSRKLFNKAFTSDLNILLGALQQERYRHSKAEVLQELDEIIEVASTTRLLTRREITALQETRLWVQAKQEGFDCVGVDCQTSSASF